MQKNGIVQNFLQDLQFFGSLSGFKHFEVTLRGKEEMLLRLKSDPKPGSKLQASDSRVCPASPSANEIVGFPSFLITGYVKYQTAQVFVSQFDLRCAKDSENGLILKV